MRDRILSLAALACAAIPSGARAQQPVLTRCGRSGATLQLSGTIVPQGTLLLAVARNTGGWKEVGSQFAGRPVPLWAEGASGDALHGLIGVDLEKEPGKYEWKVDWKDSAGQAMSCIAFVTVKTGKYPTESLKVEKKFVEPDPEQVKRAEADSRKMKAVFDTITPEKLWDGPFRMPLAEVVAGRNFGRRRILNGQARSPHTGVDFPAMTGTPVFAAQSGKVAVAEDLYYSGNTVVIDHGFGIYTLYAHLSALEVKPGDSVETGTEIGKVGATGRVTGPHLHWGLTVQHARVNAMEIVKRVP